MRASNEEPLIEIFLEIGKFFLKHLVLSILWELKDTEIHYRLTILD